MKNLVLLFVPILLFSCGNVSKNAPANAQPDWVMTKAIQDTIKIPTIISILKSGNLHFADSGGFTPKNDSMRIRVTSKGQYPMAAILSCLDSRVPSEYVVNRGIGDLFVARVAGNFANTDILGSLEYACNVSGAKVILVLGHEDCGAIKSAIKGVKYGNITAMLANLKEAVDSTPGKPRVDTNKQFVHDVAMTNIRLTIRNIRTKSDSLRKWEDAGRIKIMGGMYNLANGKITFYEYTTAGELKQL